MRIFGAKIIDQPLCLKGMKLVIDIGKFALLLEQEKKSTIGRRIPERTVVICSNYLASMSGFVQKREFPSVGNWKSRDRKKGSEDSRNSELWPISRSTKFIEIEN